ncbi:MAG TPA: geranylgeranylglycerol-phosphate geranylgeranyltransferase [Chitinophagaceae bacterium]|nr:geranylgeranylglycerol-phosphate geranylgeranyltransferase [Chitinophagaceae bacterium]
MRLIAAFARMVRLPNLFFIALSQVLFQCCIYYPLYRHMIPEKDTLHFIFLVLASLFIAAAGYIINDYFDINIDEINKPQKMVVDRIIHRRWAIAWHLIFSFTGIVFTALAVPIFQKWYLILANMACVALLWFYSTNFKKGLLIGNIVISLLTSWTILIIFFSKVSVRNAIEPGTFTQPKFFRIAFLYAGFAFVCSLIREAIKDIEDMKGDARYGSRSMPIAWGINASKVYIAVWMIVLIVMLLILGVYILQFQWWWLEVYAVLFVIIPLVLIFQKLFKASSTEDYHNLSTRIKLVMLAGILSMIFFYFYL